MHKGQELYSLPLDSAVINDLIAVARFDLTARALFFVVNVPPDHETEDQRARGVQNITTVVEIVEDLIDYRRRFLQVAICHFEGSENIFSLWINPAW